MPAKSEAQRRALNAKFGHAWVKRHHFDNKGPLPERVSKKKAKGKMKKHHHTGKLHRGHQAMHHPKGKLPHSGDHARFNKAHGTHAGFSPHPDSHRMGEVEKSHLGKNAEHC